MAPERDLGSFSAFEHILTVLRSNFDTFSARMLSWVDATEVRLRALEHWMARTDLEGVRRTLYGPQGDNGIVGKVRGLEARLANLEAAEAERAEAGRDLRVSLWWPLLVALVGGAVVAFITVRLT